MVFQTIFGDRDSLYLTLISLGMFIAALLLIFPQFVDTGPPVSIDPSSANVVLISLGAIAVSPALISSVLHYFNIRGMHHWLVVIGLSILIALLIYQLGLLEVSYRGSLFG